MERIRECVWLLLGHLGMCSPLPFAAKPRRKTVYWESEYLEADRRGVWYPAIREGQRVGKGELLGELGDFFGNSAVRYYAKEDGTVFYYTAGMSVLEGDALVAYGYERSAQDVEG